MRSILAGQESGEGSADAIFEQKIEESSPALPRALLERDRSTAVERGAKQRIGCVDCS